MDQTETQTETDEAMHIVAKALGVSPLRVIRQSLSNSGKSIYRVEMSAEHSVVLRTSARTKTFAYTERNLEVLRLLGLPVPKVLASGRTEAGGSFVILNWIPGQDLVRELGGMSKPQMSQLAKKVADCQRRVSRLPRAKGFGWAPIGQSGAKGSWSEIFGEAGETKDDGTAVGGLRVRLCRARQTLESYFRSVEPVCFLDDVHTKNVLVENGDLRGIIDVDFVCYGDPLLAVGTTLAGIIADVGESGLFYGEELVRHWNPDETQLRAIHFYAALWAIGCLSMTDPASRPQRRDDLIRAADQWLAMLEPQADPSNASSQAA
jgi:aminoglycoside phosphotransferase (APT) family kinase protein